MTELHGGHTYLSTGCLHGEHEHCQSMVGTQGEKRPGRCKFCDATCICRCHGWSDIRDESWLMDGERYTDFIEAYRYATSHFSQAAVAFAKVTPEDAWWIWRTLNLGAERNR